MTKRKRSSFFLKTALASVDANIQSLRMHMPTVYANPLIDEIERTVHILIETFEGDVAVFPTHLNQKFVRVFGRRGGKTTDLITDVIENLKRERDAADAMLWAVLNVTGPVEVTTDALAAYSPLDCIVSVEDDGSMRRTRMRATRR